MRKIFSLTIVLSLTFIGSTAPAQANIQIPPSAECQNLYFQLTENYNNPDQSQIKLILNKLYQQKCLSANQFSSKANPWRKYCLNLAENYLVFRNQVEIKTKMQVYSKKVNLLNLIQDKLVNRIVFLESKKSKKFYLKKLKLIRIYNQTSKFLFDLRQTQERKLNLYQQAFELSNLELDVSGCIRPGFSPGTSRPLTPAEKALGTELQAPFFLL
jgi:hypothetical protein